MSSLMSSACCTHHPHVIPRSSTHHHHHHPHAVPESSTHQPLVVRIICNNTQQLCIKPSGLLVIYQFSHLCEKGLMQNFVSHSEKHHYRMEEDIIFSPHENQTENFVPEHRNDHISYFFMYEMSK